MAFRFAFIILACCSFLGVSRPLFACSSVTLEDVQEEVAARGVEAVITDHVVVWDGLPSSYNLVLVQPHEQNPQIGFYLGLTGAKGNQEFVIAVIKPKNQVKLGSFPKDSKTPTRLLSPLPLSKDGTLESTPVVDNSLQTKVKRGVVLVKFKDHYTFNRWDSIGDEAVSADSKNRYSSGKTDEVKEIDVGEVELKMGAVSGTSPPPPADIPLGMASAVEYSDGSGGSAGRAIN